jgi:hypothetical protein
LPLDEKALFFKSPSKKKIGNATTHCCSFDDEPRLRYRKNIAIEELSLSAASRITKALLPERGMLQERR